MAKNQVETKAVIIRKRVWVGGEIKTPGTVVKDLVVEDANLLIGQKSAYEATEENIAKVSAEQNAGKKNKTAPK